MRYKLIVFDLDETLWTVDTLELGPISPPFERTGTDEVRGRTAVIRLHPGVRTLLRALARRRIHVSLASRSDPEVCSALLELFEIRHHFLYPQYGWQEKNHAVLNILKAFAEIDKETIAPVDVLFVDDWPGNVDAVRRTGAATLLFGRDVRSIQELRSIFE